MKRTKLLAQAGQSVWIDDITRPMLTEGRLRRLIDEFSVTGLTSNPTIFAKAASDGGHYDDLIAAGDHSGKSDEEIFFDFALRDLTEAADLFRDVFVRTSGADGWVSLEVSPLLAEEAEATIRCAIDLHRRAKRPNLFIKIPGTKAGLRAIEETIFAGVPVNVTLLFNAEQYRAAADAWLRGIERRIDAGLTADVASVASLFVSRWDGAVAATAPGPLRNKIGLAIAERAHGVYRELLASERWRRVMNCGARPQRFLFASTGTKDPAAPDTLYVEGLVAPLTVNTMPEKTMMAFADHGDVHHTLPADTKQAEEVLSRALAAGIDLEALAVKLQRDGAAAFVKSWEELLHSIQSRRAIAVRNREPV